MQFHTVKVTIAAIAATLCTLAASAQFYPANGTKDAPYDAQLVITFDDEPELVPGSFVTISDASGKAVDKIAFTDDTQIFADNTPIAVVFLVVSGKKRNFGDKLYKLNNRR